MPTSRKPSFAQKYTAKKHRAITIESYAALTLQQEFATMQLKHCGKIAAHFVVNIARQHYAQNHAEQLSQATTLHHNCLFQTKKACIHIIKKNASFIIMFYFSAVCVSNGYVSDKQHCHQCAQQRENKQAKIVLEKVSDAALSLLHPRLPPRYCPFRRRPSSPWRCPKCV